MEKIIFYFGSLFLLMLITGVFWGTWFTLTRSIDDFSPAEFIHIGKVIISNVAVPMRIIMPAGIVIVLLSLLISGSFRSPGFYFGIASFILIVTVLLVTLIVLVPLDNKIKTWSISSIPGNWTDIRKKWASFHTIRTFASIFSFACYLIYLISILPGR